MSPKWMMFGAMLCVIGSSVTAGCFRCKSSEQKTSALAVGNSQCEEDFIGFCTRTAYSRKVLGEIRSAAESGDLHLARECLMTNVVFDAFDIKYGNSFRSGVWGGVLTLLLYNRVAIDVLAAMESQEARELLGSYFYGERQTDSPELTQSTVESILAQLVSGPYVSPESRRLDKSFEVKGIERSADEKEPVFTALVGCHISKDIQMMRLKFRQVDVGGRKLWMPTAWWLGGRS